MDTFQFLVDIHLFILAYTYYFNPQNCPLFDFDFCSFCAVTLLLSIYITALPTLLHPSTPSTTAATVTSSTTTAMTINTASVSTTVTSITTGKSVTSH